MGTAEPRSDRLPCPLQSNIFKQDPGPRGPLLGRPWEGGVGGLPPRFSSNSDGEEDPPHVGGPVFSTQPHILGNINGGRERQEEGGRGGSHSTQWDLPMRHELCQVCRLLLLSLHPSTPLPKQPPPTGGHT